MEPEIGAVSVTMRPVASYSKDQLLPRASVTVDSCPAGLYAYVMLRPSGPSSSRT